MAAKEELRSALRKNYDTKLFAVEVLSKVFGNLLEVYNSEQKPSEQPNNTESKVIESVGIYAKISLDDDVEVLCYEMDLKPHVRIDQSKVAIQHYVRKLLTSGQAALINFVSPTYKDMWRFTLVAKDSELTSIGIREKVTHPKRYTFLVETGTDKQNKTLTERLEWLSIESDKNMEALVEAFSVEKMSTAFFDEYKEHYQNFVQYLTGKRMVRKGSKWEEQTVTESSAFLKSVFNGDEKNTRDFCKKLLGRIVFLYFVQKKKWLGASDTNYEDGSQNFIFELFEETGGDERFFPHGLTELFFNALNSERPNDDYTTQTGRKVKIPYLNGGLFTRDEVDELLHKKGDMMTFPSELFSNPEKNDIPIPKGASIVIKETPYRGFLDFLNAFNFTVYEDSQDDHTVAVDPEMLGHIFENLLEDNKDKGAYYTPKQIVSYMCQESLLEYLRTHLGEKIRIDELGKLVREKEPNGIAKAILLKVNKKLDEVKICDPAIGSGAFPMGLLQEIFSIKEIISYETDASWNPAQVKEDIIQNSIYGVDIEKGAVDIARLRFWLSLVVDKDKPKALPNLDYKIVVGNSLVPKFDGEVIDIEWKRKESVGAGKKFIARLQDTLRLITNKQKQFFDPGLKEKKKLAVEISNLKLEVLVNQLSFNKELFLNKTQVKGGFDPSGADKKLNLERELTIKSFDQTIKKLKSIKNDKKKSFKHFDWKLDFPEILNDAVSDKKGFDIVIGNPPYGADFTKEEKGFIKQNFYSMEGDFDSYIYFTEHSLSLTHGDSVISFIIPNNVLLQKFTKKIRELILKSAHINSIIDLGLGVFNDAVVPTAILIMSKGYQESNLVRTSYRPNDLLKTEYQLVQQSTFEGNNNFGFNIKLTNREREVIEKLKDSHPILSDIVELKIGIEAKPQYINDEPISEHSKPMVRGRNFDKYYLYFEKDSKFIEYIRENLHRAREERLFDCPRKILIRQTGDRIIATIDSQRLYAWKSVFVILSDESNFHLNYILGIINSKAINFFYQKLVGEEGRVFAQVKGVNVNLIPIPRLSPNEQKHLIQLADYLLFLKPFDFSEISDKLMISYFEQIIDGIVYELYFPSLLKKYDREIIKHLGELPEFTDGMSDQNKMNVCKSVFQRLDDKEHPVRNNIFYMDSIPEIAIIEGKNEDH